RMKHRGLKQLVPIIRGEGLSQWRLSPHLPPLLRHRVPSESLLVLLPELVHHIPDKVRKVRLLGRLSLNDTVGSRRRCSRRSSLASHYSLSVSTKSQAENWSSAACFSRRSSRPYRPRSFAC